MSPEFGTVAVVIPTYNRADLLQSVLSCVRRQTYPIERIVVADNGSTDDSSRVAERAGAAVVRLSANQGFAAAVNRGISECSSDWFAILNNDVTIPPGWLSTLVRCAQTEDAGFATGKLMSAADPRRIDGTFDLVSRGATTWRCGNGRSDGPQWARSRRARLVSFTAVLVRRSAWEAVGGLDERFESYLEDTDWSLRCAAKGISGVYVPDAVGFHAGSATLGAWRKATVRLIARNQILLFAKHFRGGAWTPALAGQLLWTALAFRNGSGWSALAGKIEGLSYYRRWKLQPSSWPAAKDAIEESEQTILAVQKETGFDTYWRLYFRLVGK